jgi:hypothetical protein
LIDKSVITDNYIGFSEPCNGAFCEFAKLSFGDDQFIMVNTPYRQNTSQMLGLTIYKFIGEELVEVKDPMFLQSPSKLQSWINGTPEAPFAKINSYFKGKIPLCIELPK